MPTVRLILKGTTIEEAKEALKAHGIDEYISIDPPDRGEVDVLLEDPDMRAIIRWHNEEPYSAPYPPGALLMYTTLSEEPHEPSGYQPDDRGEHDDSL